MQPDSGLFYMHDPEDAFEHTDFLRRVAASDPRRLFVPITPGADNVRTVGSDILKALGKDRDIMGSGRSGRDTWLRAQLWLQVSEVQDVFISRAHLLTPWLMEQVVHAALMADVRLVLIFQIAELRKSQQRFIANWPLQPLSVAQLTRTLKIKRQPTRKALPPTRRLPAVPIDDFTSFRAAAKQLLDADDFAAVDGAFRAAFEATAAYLRGRRQLTESAICEHVRELIADSDWMPEIITRVRGSQVAAFHAGFLMKVNLDVLATTRAPRVRLDEATLDILEEFDTPRLAAAAALTAATGLPLDEILAVNVDDVGAGGVEIRIGQRVHELPPRAARMLEVLVRERLAYFAADHDPLLIYIKGVGRQHGKMIRWTNRGMSDSLKRVERETGLMLTTHLTDAGQRDAVAWARRRGISLQRILNG